MHFKATCSATQPTKTKEQLPDTHQTITETTQLGRPYNANINKQALIEVIWDIKL